ncbi:hypothetical protein QFC21_007242, partial [Naganishia friedmannii]
MDIPSSKFIVILNLFITFSIDALTDATTYAVTYTSTDTLARTSGHGSNQSSQVIDAVTTSR